MALNLSRWVSYAKTRLEAAVGRGNDELTRLEAEREVELADKPWLRADAEAPTLDEARARIEWEARRQEELAAARDTAPTRPNDPAGPASGSGSNTGPGTDTDPGDDTDTGTDTGARPGAPTTPGDPEELRLAAEAELAKLAIEARDRAAAERLDEIRRELGVDAPPPSPSDAPDDDAG